MRLVVLIVAGAVLYMAVLRLVLLRLWAARREVEVLTELAAAERLRARSADVQASPVAPPVRVNGTPTIIGRAEE